VSNNSGVGRWVLAGLAALAGCAGEPEPRLTHRLSPQAIAAVRLDPNAAVSALNAYRASKGLKTVRLDPALTAMAERQAKAMAAGNALSHDVAGAFPARLAESGIDTWKAGENLGGGYMSLAEAFAGWRESPGHDGNLLLPDGSRFGIAIAKNPDTQYGVYWAMEIAAEPSPAAPRAEAPFSWGGTSLQQ
jgi:Cysteine-rich secretory protein family